MSVSSTSAAFHLEDRKFCFNGAPISVYVARPARADIRAGAILVHGLGGRKDSETHLNLVPRLARAGVVSLRFDFPGHGDSGGSTATLTIGSGSRLVEAMLALLAKEAPRVPIAMLGASFGGSVILNCDKTAFDVRALILRSPVTAYAALRKRQLGEDGMKEWQKSGTNNTLISGGRETPYDFYREAKAIDLLQKGAAENIPLLIVQGSRDDTVPLEETKNYLAARGGKSSLIIIDGGDHSLSDPTHTTLFSALSIEWIKGHCPALTGGLRE